MSLNKIFVQIITQCQKMSINQVSVICIREIHNDETTNEINREKDTKLNFKEFFKVIVFSSIGIVGTSVLFTFPWIIIPRANSIIYQSAWMEIQFPLVFNYVLVTGNEVLNLKIYTKEEAMMSVRIFLRIFLMYLISGNGLYMMSYLLWTKYLGFYHPLPNVGLIMTLTQWTIIPVGLWLLLPSALFVKRGFRRKLRYYTIQYLWSIIVVFALEVVSYLFANLSAQLELLACFIFIAIRELDRNVRCILIKKAVGEDDEPAAALLAITISGTYAFYIAIKLVGAEVVTMCCFLILDTVHHLSITHQIIKEQKKITDEIIDTGYSTKSMFEAKLSFAELIEGYTPIIYGICIVAAYNGPNSHILGNVGNSYWSYQEIDDIGALFWTMFLLFSVDIISVLLNSVCLWKMVHLSMIRNFHGVLKQYWFYMAIKLGYYMSTLFISLDVNFASDGTGKYKWITHEGWQNLVNTSNYLTDVEKCFLLTNFTMMTEN